MSRSKSRATVNHHGLRTFAALQHVVLRVYNRLPSSCSVTGGVQAPLRPSGVKTPILRKSAVSVRCSAWRARGGPQSSYSIHPRPWPTLYVIFMGCLPSGRSRVTAHYKYAHSLTKQFVRDSDRAAASRAAEHADGYRLSWQLLDVLQTAANVMPAAGSTHPLSSPENGCFALFRTQRCCTAWGAARAL